MADARARSGPKFKRTEREQVRGMIARWWHEGYTYPQIAEKIRLETGMRMHRVNVIKTMTDIRAEWRTQRLDDVQAHVDEQLEFLRMYEQVCWDEYRRSQGDHTVTTSSMKSTPPKSPNAVRAEAATNGIQIARTAPTIPEPQPVETRTGMRVEKKLGDPRYLVCIQWARTMRIKILGLVAPDAHLHLHGPDHMDAPPVPPVTDPEWSRAESVLRDLYGGGSGVVDVSGTIVDP